MEVNFFTKKLLCSGSICDYSDGKFLEKSVSAQAEQMSVTRHVGVTNKNKDNKMSEGFLGLASKSALSVKELTNVVLKSLEIN